jgi:tRNA A37 methylthiotransferase MiaB
VLVEGPSKSEKGISHKMAQGRTDGNEIVHIPCPDASALVGHLVTVTIVRANHHSLSGEAADLPPLRVGRRSLPIVAD